MLDLAVRGGMVVDGTGRPARRADVGVREGRIVAVGTLDEPTARSLDATDLLVAPGFVDLHTHYDAQLFWDPTASPSPLHGVTTVIGGNCGFSLAPMVAARPGGPPAAAMADNADYLARMMAKVEGMPLEPLLGLPWSWPSFGAFLDALDGRIGVHAGFLVGHSTLRRAVLGEAAGEPADDRQVRAMRALLARCLEEGALGFSTSRAPTHHDGAGAPVPSRSASDAELLALAAETGRHPGTTVELIVPGCLNGFTDAEVALMAEVSLAANRPVNWNVLGVSAANPDSAWRQLDASTVAARRGGRVVALTLPHTMRLRLSFSHGAILDGLPGWGELFGLPPAERLARLADRSVRRRLDQQARSKEAGILGALARWEHLVVEETFTGQTAAYEGRRIGEIAAERGVDPFDALCDIVVADGLRTGLRPPIPETEEDWPLRAAIWQDDRTVVGGSDAGAHLDVMCGAIYTTALLGDGVRQRGLLSWEEAVRQLTDVPARLYGLVGRGRIADGAVADLVVFDPARIGHRPERTRTDLPGGASRLTAEAEGIEHVVVAGVEVVVAGELTGATPGRVLRSGRDTTTVLPSSTPVAAAPPRRRAGGARRRSRSG
jgi:N-acyl-D-aspartate/D-glutamate deacylase